MNSSLFLSVFAFIFFFLSAIFAIRMHNIYYQVMPWKFF